MSGQTRAQMADEITRLRDDLAAARRYAPNDAEAEAIARCIKALEPLVRDNRTTWGAESGGAIRRVLHYLAKRNGITLYDEAQMSYTICDACREKQP